MRDLTRRLSPLALAGLALAATVAGWPAPALATPAANSSSPARHRPSVLPPAAMFGRAASESSAVLRLASHNRSGRVPAEQAPVPAGGGVTPLGQLRSSDVLVIAPKALPRSTAATLAKLPGVVAAQSLDAAQIKIKGTEAAVLGVDPSAFRGFAAKPTARSSELWQGVADGRIAVSWTMGRLGKLPLGGRVKVTGKHTERLMVGGFGTVGIPGIDGIVSHAVARSLGLPSGNAVVISAPKARLTTLDAQIRQHLPRGATVVPLVTQEATSATPVSQSGLAGASGSAAQDGPGLTQAQLVTFLKAAESRIGLPYVWGGSGPKVFDCSGLVQWSLAQAGVTVPRVAVDQARTGPAVPVSQLQAGDLLFYHTDPTAPTYISHVAIYLGHGQMLQAPRPGLNVEVVPVDTGSGFAGAVRVYPQVAAAAAGVSG